MMVFLGFFSLVNSAVLFWLRRVDTVKARVGRPIPSDDTIDRERFQSDLNYRLRVFSAREAAQRTSLRWFFLVAAIFCFAIAIWG